MPALPPRYFAARYFAPRYFGTLAIYFDPLEAVQAYWKSRPDLRARTPDGKLWELEAKEGTGHPFAECFLVSEEDAQVPTAPAGWKVVRSVVQVSCHDATSQGAKDLRRAIESAFHLAPMVIQGGSVLHCLAHSPSTAKGKGKGPGGKDSFMATIDLEILWIQPTPILHRP